MKSYHVIITGRVQGVFFREYTRQKAMECCLTGWVRNLPDGTVECEVTGKSENIKTLLDWFWTGSPLSGVTEVMFKEIPIDTSPENFTIRR